MRARTIVVLPLILILSAVTALAYATPPDRLWWPGIWDDGDDDVVVLLVTGTVGTFQGRPVLPAAPRIVVWTLLTTDHDPAPAPSPAAGSVRAPPQI